MIAMHLPRQTTSCDNTNTHNPQHNPAGGLIGMRARRFRQPPAAADPAPLSARRLSAFLPRAGFRRAVDGLFFGIIAPRKPFIQQTGIRRKPDRRFE